MYKSKINIAIAVFSFIILAASCKKKDDPVTTTPTTTTGGTGTIGFEISNYAGTAPLVMNTDSYTTAGGESIIVKKFNYYISNIHVQKNDGTEFVESESYHLVQGNLASTKHFHLKDVPAGTYTSITFLIGVDSTRNVSGAQTGALDQTNGMFWTWVSGYIMAKLEGTSPQSMASDKSFTWHIGGFAGPNAGVRKVTIKFPKDMVLTANSEGTIDMKADALKWFSSGSTKIASNAEIMSVNAASSAIADNYANMFSISNILVTAE